MKKFRFYAHFNNGKSTDWIYCSHDSCNAKQFLFLVREHNVVIDDNGAAFYIDWNNVDCVKCEEVK